MEFAAGIVVGIVLHKHKDKVSQICIHFYDKIKSVFRKKV